MAEKVSCLGAIDRGLEKGLNVLQTLGVVKVLPPPTMVELHGKESCARSIAGDASLMEGLGEIQVPLRQKNWTTGVVYSRVFIKEDWKVYIGCSIEQEA